MFIDGGTGNVGIGTTTPSKSLTISGVTNPTMHLVSSSGAGAFQMKAYANYSTSDSYGLSGYNDYNIIRGRTLNGYGDVFVGRNDAVTILGSTGNVGIGTTTPVTKLVVSDGGSSLSALSVYNSTYGVDVRLAASIGVTNAAVLYTVGAHDFRFGTNNAENMRIQASTGNVGIGETAPGSKLSVSGGGSFGAGYDTTAAPTGGLIIEGNVGIGTTTPSSLLHVAGSTATSTVTIGKVGSVGCIAVRDTDNAGYTYLTTLNGVLTASMTPCE